MPTACAAKTAPNAYFRATGFWQQVIGNF